MLLPQFSIRRILLFVTLFAVWCWAAIQAWHGVLVAQAIQFAFAAWILWLLLHAVVTSLGYLVMRITQSLRPQSPQSPFAHETEAPQILPPRDIPLD